MNIPKHRFICWLMVQRRLHTTDFLFKIGVVGIINCLFYGDDVEYHSHLFSNCCFIKLILKMIMEWL